MEAFVIAKKVGKVPNVIYLKRIAEWPTVPDTVFVKVACANANKDGKEMIATKV